MIMFTTPNLSEVRVWIIAHNPLARLGLSALLKQQSSISVSADYPSNADLSGTLDSQSSAERPDCLIWDLDWAADSTALAASAPNLPPILALVGDADGAAEAWAAGASGILQRSAAAETITTAAQSVAHRLRVFDPLVAGNLLSARLPTPQESLTDREREVLTLMAEGLPNKTIAARLKISENTVKFHINAILGKLGAQSRTEAVVRAARLGMIAL